MTQHPPAADADAGATPAQALLPASGAASFNGAAADTRRNAACPCGSGLRYKGCCGTLASNVALSPDDAAAMQRALELQVSGSHEAAAAIYRAVLAQEEAVADAHHMLGVILLQRGEHAAALDRLRRAAELFGWQVPAVAHNLGLALAPLLARRDVAATAALRAAYARWLKRARSAARSVPARVSVVIPSFNHAAYVEAALESVFAQTHAPCELIVVDDGSADDSVPRIERALARCPFPSRRFVRANRGAAATINEAIERSTGDYVNVLNSDDRFAPTRLAAMTSAIAGSGSEWGFSRVAFVDARGDSPGDAAARRAAQLGSLGDAAAADADSVGMSFLGGNAAISTGALFFARTLFERVGGFRDFRYTHDWDFCLRASAIAEPIIVPTAEYEYRMHATNTILEDSAVVVHETATMLARFHREIVEMREPPSAFAPAPAVWGARFFERALAWGHALLLPTPVLRDLSEVVAADRGGTG